MQNPNSSHNTDAQEILLAGDISRAFSSIDALGELPCEVRTNIIDAVNVAAKKRFGVICVVMSAASAKLSSALATLRQVNPNAKIVLLAQMYEEPTAIELVGSPPNGPNLADDYLICPIDLSRFYELIIPTESRPTVKTLRPKPPDADTEMKIKQLEKLATEDDLTGLKNRRYIWEFSRQIIDRATRQNGRVTLLVFDIDDFKHYNDTYGHSVGDKILKQAAVLMRRTCRRHDVVGRIGGDEFAVVFWDDQRRKTAPIETERRSTRADHPKEAIFIAKRLGKELQKAELHLLGPEGKGVLTISGALARFPRDGSTIQQLFQQADNALLEAKRKGKNRIYLVGKPPNDIADID